MKASTIIRNLSRLIEKHGDRECFVGILLCDPANEPARDHRFCVTGFKATDDATDTLDCNRGPAFEIKIHQNESLRSWEDGTTKG